MGHNNLLIVRISRLTLLCLIVTLFPLRILSFLCFAVSFGAKSQGRDVSVFRNNFLKTNMKLQINPSEFVKMND